MLAAKLENPSSVSRSTWWEESPDSSTVWSDLCTQAAACTLSVFKEINVKRKIKSC